MSLLIKNGAILTATGEFAGEIYIEDETIQQIGAELSVKAGRTVEASAS